MSEQKKIIKKNVYNIKIILLGEGEVGKTKLINAYFGNDFTEDNSNTEQPSRSFDKIEIKNNICYIDIWDTMGQEKYRSMTSNFIKGSHIIIFVYDITRKKTLTELDYWVGLVKEQIDNENVIFGLVGNKIDLFDNVEVEKEEGEKYAKEIIAYFSEASAKENPKGFNKFVNKLIEKLFLNEDNIEKEGNIVEKIENSMKIEKKNIKKKKKEKNKCC